jgi:hypothetical protein
MNVNRSTPINNLPQNSFVNDQQRQIVMQAQQAITNMQLPQNTQLTQPNFEAPNEDDATIQEVLNQIQSSTQNTGEPQNPQLQLQQQHQMPSIPALPPQPPQYVHSQQDISANQALQYLGQYPPQPQQYVDGGLLSNRVPDQNSMLSSITAVAHDVKLATFVFVLFIIVQFVPVEKFLTRYIAIDKIPYYQIIVKALIAFVAVILFKKFFS